MKQDDRSDPLAALCELSDAAPKSRLGRLICNPPMHVGEPESMSVRDVEVQDLCLAAREFLNSLPEHMLPTATS